MSQKQKRELRGVLELLQAGLLSLNASVKLVHRVFGIEEEDSSKASPIRGTGGTGCTKRLEAA